MENMQKNRQEDDLIRIRENKKNNKKHTVSAGFEPMISLFTARNFNHCVANFDHIDSSILLAL